jgi:hypothetical protein
MSLEKRKIPLTPVMALSFFFHDNFVKQQSSLDNRVAITRNKNKVDEVPLVSEVVEEDESITDEVPTVSEAVKEERSISASEEAFVSRLKQKNIKNKSAEAKDQEKNNSVEISVNEDDQDNQIEQIQPIVWVFNPKTKKMKWTKKEIAMKLWNAGWIIVLPLSGAYVAKVYYSKSKDFFLNFIPERMDHPPTKEEWTPLRNAGEVTGQLAVTTNVLFNLIQGFKVAMMKFVFGDEYERVIYFHIMKTPRFWAETIILGLISIYSTISLSNISLQEEKNIDFAVVNTFIFGILSGFLGMQFFYDSLKWLGSTTYEGLRAKGLVSPAMPEEIVVNAILKYHRNMIQAAKNDFRARYGIRITSNSWITPSNQPIDNSLWGKLKPYVITSPFTLLLLNSRLGLVYNAYDGSTLLSLSSEFLLWVNTVNSSLPSVAWALKGFSNINAALYYLLSGNASDDISLAQEIFPAERFLLLFWFQNFALGSFASNSKICVEAAEKLGFDFTSVIFYAVMGGLGSNIVNMYGMIMLVETLIEYIVLYLPQLVHEFKALYAQLVSTLKRFVGYMELVFRDQKTGIEYLMHNPDIIPEIKQLINSDIILANKTIQDAVLNVGFVVEDIVRVQKEAEYTKDEMKVILRMLNFPVKLQRQFDSYDSTAKNLAKSGLSFNSHVNIRLLESSKSRNYNSINDADKEDIDLEIVSDQYKGFGLRAATKM